MDSCTIQLTSGAVSNNKLNVRACGLEFFPEGILGGSTKDNLGQQVTIQAKGLSTPIKTDIPTYKHSGRPRWFFRERTGISNFIRTNNLKPGDKVVIRRISNKKYELIPQLLKPKFIDLFADFLFILRVAEHI
jgi:hypothetical protein